ncbi:MAG: ribosomal-processing cysteine protease Prp [Lachnospiraceae bacterium]|nr:ribosomal-processing cysteine protease Prp [Candidatus Colinaster equi]
MTEITFVKSNDKYRGFECHGHADYADEGEDIVCAGISALTINTMNSIDHFLDDVLEITSNSESGDIQCYVIGDISKEATLLFDSLYLGLTMIADQYGERFVKVEIQEV